MLKFITFQRTENSNKIDSYITVVGIVLPMKKVVSKNSDTKDLVLRKKDDNEFRIFSLRLRDTMVKDLDEIACRTSRSRNEVIVLLLEYALEHCRVEDDEES